MPGPKKPIVPDDFSTPEEPSKVTDDPMELLHRINGRVKALRGDFKALSELYTKLEGAHHDAIAEDKSEHERLEGLWDRLDEKLDKKFEHIEKQVYDLFKDRLKIATTKDTTEIKVAGETKIQKWQVVKELSIKLLGPALAAGGGLAAAYLIKRCAS